MTQPSERVRELPWDSGRDPAVDLVRGTAVVCMVIAHIRVWAPTGDARVQTVLDIVNDVASPLFALVMGVSAGIVLTRRSRPVVGRLFVERNLVRGLVLITIGLALEQLGTFVAIVLMSLGATLVVAAPFALLPARVLAVITLVVFAAGPAVNAAARAALDPVRVHSLAIVDQLLQWFVLSTHYRVVSLLPFVLGGVLLARAGLTARAALTSLAVGVAAGVALRLGGHGIDMVDVVSGGVPDALRDVMLAATAFGSVVLLARWTATRYLVTALAPVRAVGALALSAYVLHVCLIALAQRVGDPRAPYDSWPTFAGGILVVTVLACWAWWHLLGKGPIERLMALVTDRME